jgi:hypothetical protein
MKRNIWIPKMTKGRLEKLLSKLSLTDDDKEDLLDYKYFLMNEKVSAYEKQLMDAVLVNQSKQSCDIDNCVLVPKNKFWLTNISYLTEGFKSEYYV